LDRLEVAELLDAAGGDEVIENRLVPCEPLEPHDLLGQERAVVAELNVTLARHLAPPLIGRHGRRISPGDRASTFIGPARSNQMAAQGGACPSWASSPARPGL